MKRIYIALFALVAATLCACSTTPSGSAPAAASAASSPSATAMAMNTAEMEKMIIDMEKKAWDLYINKKVKEWKKLHLPGHQEMYSGAIKSPDESVNDTKDDIVKSIAYSDWKVYFPVKDTAILTYKYTINYARKGQERTDVNVAMGTWVNINGEWKATFYTDQKAAPEPKK